MMMREMTVKTVAVLRVHHQAGMAKRPLKTIRSRCDYGWQQRKRDLEHDDPCC